MKASLFSKAALIAIASLGIAGAVQAKDLQPQDFNAVKAGMTQAQVEQALGKPVQARNFSLSNTSTWTYNTTDSFSRNGDRVYDVDFGSDGKVISASETGRPVLNTSTEH